VVILFAFVAIAARAIDKAGFLASVAVGYSILFGGGWGWFVIVASFFILGVGFTYYKYEYKKSIGSAQGKGGTRNWPNILANGAVAAVLGLAQLFSGGTTFVASFLGAMSTAASDTVATEVGLLSKSKPRLITQLGKSVVPGTSGGVSVLGFLGAIMASALIGGLAFVLNLSREGFLIVPISIISGFVGAVADSILGATVQRKGYCAVCGAQTENLLHHGEPTKVVSGLPFVDNNFVNLLATIVGAIAAFSISLVH
jgi:uncharacterized protein (TIGR00297 family)